MLFFVEAATSGSGLRMLRALTERGEPTAFITSNRAKYAAANDARVLDHLEAFGRLVEVASTEDYHLPEAVTSMPGPHGVVASGDRYLAYASCLAEDLGAPFPTSGAVEVLRDKRRARALYDDLGVGRVRWARAESEEQVRAFATHTAATGVIKNVHGTGSQDVRVYSGADEAVLFWRELVAKERYLQGELMVEEYVQGPLVSCEVLVSAGVAQVLGYTDRQLSPFPTVAEIGYTFPADLPGPLRDDMRHTVDAVVAALGIEQAFLHVEFVLREANAHLVEVNPRLPGALVTYMLQDCLTDDFAQMVADSALGRTVPTTSPNGLVSSGYIAYAPTRARATAPSDRDAAARFPWVVDVLGGVDVGAEIAPASDYRGAVGHVRALASSQSIAQTAARAAAELMVPPSEPVPDIEEP
ncbi:acetyl-CoA carboxylase biotin carboxylase subunit family protein [Curtobacterium sp. ISL-83]|uniref:ATP-grasp domain-containing protein n=1 Tax=Curtobacterium sp. ISL-83 TaxID=2819145 RepID=UPI001BE8BDE6|nr:ATP-grasp domain-containing protein [Curtobacterium sp. ISL-83]MBT2504246.1 ATP-grasp domain-containing protein [Curtobacterium sp. ISL-83]